MKRKSSYAIFVLILSAVYYGMLVLVSLTAQKSGAHEMALVVSSITIAMMAIYLCEHLGFRADILLLLTMVAYWVILIPLAYFTPDNWLFLNIDAMVYCQGLPILIIALIWYAYQAILASLDKGDK